jgi:hypothetical protein
MYRLSVRSEQGQRARSVPFLPDETVRVLADGLSAPVTTRRGPRAHVMSGPGDRAVASAHDGTADQGGPGSPQDRFPDPPGRHPLPAPVLAGQHKRPGARAAQAPQGRRVPRHPGAGHGLGHGAGTARRTPVPGAGQPVHALHDRLQPLFPPDEAPGGSAERTLTCCATSSPPRPLKPTRASRRRRSRLSWHTCAEKEKARPVLMRHVN